MNSPGQLVPNMLPEISGEITGPITSWQIEGEKVEAVIDFLLGSKITVDGDCNHEIKRCLFLERKTVKNLNNMLKSRDIAYKSLHS